MPDVVAAVLGWLVPAAIVVAAAAIIVGVLIWSVRRSRRSPRARDAAQAARAKAGSALVRLDDAVESLDLEVGLSGALHGPDASGALRRARMTAQHVRDEALAQYEALSDPGMLPAHVQRRSTRIEQRVTDALAVIGRARADHDRWVTANVPANEQIAAARRRLAELRQGMGEPAALVRELSARFDPSEWQDAAAAADDAVAATAEAERRLDVAAAIASNSAQTARPELAAAERALRRAHDDARALEETHRVALQAAEALPAEFEVITAALRQAGETARRRLEPDAAGRLADEVRVLESSVAALRTDAARRPTATVAAIARLRDRLDAAIGDARTPQQRMRDARTALAVTLAAARGAVAHAEASVSGARSGADARARLAAAEHELAAARTSTDPVAALEAARRAIRHADDAKALADDDRSTVR